MSKGIIRVITGIPGSGKTRWIDEIIEENPEIRKIYLTHSHKLLYEREKKEKNVTHWKGITKICPRKGIKHIKNRLSVKAPTSWICEICQSKRLIEKDKCPHKKQFVNPSNTVIAPVDYLFTNQVKTYDPELIIVDDVLLKKQHLPSLSRIRTYVRTLYLLKYWEYSTVEELFEKKKTKDLLSYIKKSLSLN